MKKMDVVDNLFFLGETGMEINSLYSIANLKRINEIGKFIYKQKQLALLEKSKASNIQVYLGDGMHYYESLEFFKEHKASHFVAIYQKQALPEVEGFLMLGYISYEEAEDDLYRAEEIGEIIENKIMSVDEALQGQLN